MGWLDPVQRQVASSTSHLGHAREVLNVNWQTPNTEQGSATDSMDLKVEA